MRNRPLQNASSLPVVARSTMPHPSDTQTESKVERFIEISETEAASLGNHLDYSKEMGEILLRLHPEISRKNPQLAARIWSLVEESGFALHIARINLQTRLKEAAERDARRKDQGENHA